VTPVHLLACSPARLLGLFFTPTQGTPRYRKNPCTYCTRFICATVTSDAPEFSCFTSLLPYCQQNVRLGGGRMQLARTERWLTLGAKCLGMSLKETGRVSCTEAVLEYEHCKTVKWIALYFRSLFSSFFSLLSPVRRRLGFISGRKRLATTLSLIQ
jgi:hypothetical protein